jgi:hypothetical protein
MKQFFLAIALSAVAFLSTAARPISPEYPAVEKVFRQVFAGASNVTWTKEEGDLLKASFLWGEHHTIAYFDNTGRLVGSIRGLFFSQLPLSVVRSVKSNFEGHVVIETREISNDEGTSYSIVTEYKDRKYKLRLDSVGGVLDMEKVKK